MHLSTFITASLTEHGTEWKGKWNGTKIFVWNMEDARMELVWKISRME